MKNPTREDVEQQLEHVLLGITHNVVSVPLSEYQNIRRAYLRALAVVKAVKRGAPKWIGEHAICPEREKCPECDLVRALARFDGGDDD